MRKKFFILFLLCYSFFAVNFNVSAEEVDVILFTGQSNMVGRGATKEVGNGNNADFSKLDGKIYEYKYSTNTLVEYNESNNIPSNLGEANRICDQGSPSYCVITEEWSYPVVAEFAEQYVKLTGHSVVLVPAAVGGRGIAYFDPNYVADTMESVDQNLFNHLVKKYNGAISYLKNNGYTINNEFYIMYDGEGDNILSYERYKELYLKFHNGIMNSTTLDFGAVITPGLNYTDTNFTTLKQEYKVGDYQKKLMEITSDLILATDKTIELSTYPAVKDNYTDTVHFDLESLKIIATDAANNIVNTKKLYKKYTVKYDCNGGEGTISPSIHIYDQLSKLNENSCTKENYTFKGWSTNKEDAEVKYTDKQEIKNLVSTDDGIITLYAVWNPNSYTVKYDCNGGEGTISPSIHIYDQSSKLNENSCIKENYTFKGWSTNKEDAEVEYTDKQEVKNMVSSNSKDITLYAVWEKLQNDENPILKNNGIIISYDLSNFDRKINLLVELIDKDNLLDDEINLLKKNLERYLIYDISIVDENNVTIQPNGNIKVYFPIPEGYDKENLVINRIDGNKLIKYETTINDNKIIIETDHFSKYVLGEKNMILNPNTSDNIIIYIVIGTVLIGLIILILFKIKKETK